MTQSEARARPGRDVRRCSSHLRAEDEVEAAVLDRQGLHRALDVRRRVADVDADIPVGVRLEVRKYGFTPQPTSSTR